MYLTTKPNFNFFDEMFRAPFRAGFPTGEGSVKLMRTDIKENADSFDLSIDLPGYEKEDIKAELKEGYLNITAEKNTENEVSEDDGKYIRKERFSGTCKRSFYVGDYLTEEDIKGSFKDGVLMLNIPKEPEPEKEEPKLIAIN